MIALAAPRIGWPVMAGAACLLAALPALSLGAQLAVSLPAVAVFGLPHGATDWWLAAHRLPERLPAALRRLWVPLFGVAYLLVALVALGGIMAAPGPALLVFIAISAWHFGAVDAASLDVPPSPTAVMGIGLLPIAAPALFHPHAVGILVAALGVSQADESIGLLGGFGVGLAVLTASLATAVTGAAPCRALLTEQAACLLLMAASPPLLGFLVYFCLIHAPRQAASLDVRGNALIVWASAAFAALAIAAFLLARPAALTLSAALPPRAVQALFWGLAVLTFPHVLCGWLLRAPQSGAQPGPPASTAPLGAGEAGAHLKDASPWQ